MSSTNIAIKYRPIRIGFLVREGSIDDIVKAAGINTMLWGGIHNPIIPVRAQDSTFSDQLISLFSVDVLYGVSNESEIISLIQKYPFLRNPEDYSESIYHEDWRTKKMLLSFLDSKNIVDYYWEKELKHNPKDIKSRFLLLKWQEDDPLSSLFSLQFGYFPKLQGVEFKYDYEHYFLKGLRADQKEIVLGATLDFNIFQNFSPINITDSLLRAYSGEFRYYGNGIYIGDSNNFEDLVTYWNLRAAGIYLAFFAKDATDRTLSLAQSYLSELDKLPNRHPNWEDNLWVYYKIENEAAINELTKKFTTTKHIQHYPATQLSWNGLNIKPAYSAFGWEHTMAEVDKPYNQYAITIRLPNKTFLVESYDYDDVGWQKLVINIDAYAEFGYPNHTLKPPNLRELNEFYASEIAFDPWVLRIEKEGLAYITMAHTNSLTLHPLSHQTLIERVFEVKGIQAKISQAGLLSKKVIEMLDGIDGTRFLKIKGVRKLLQEKDSTDFITRSYATRVIHDNDFEKHKKLFIEPRNTIELSKDQVFDFLLKNDLFRAGLELSCESCNLKNWLTLKQLDDQWHCEFCGAVNKTSTQLRHRGDWKFRKSGLFAKDNNQEGAIPVILALLTFYRIFDHSQFVYSTSLKLEGDGINCETDFAVLQYHFGDSVELGIGECKSEGGTITQEVFDKLLSVQKKLSVDHEIRCFITFAKTADTFTLEELDRFKEFKKAGVPLILLTNRELEPYHPYWEDANSNMNKYPHTLSEIANNSEFRYLKV